MAPQGPKANHVTAAATPSSGTPKNNEVADVTKGPHPGLVHVASQYTFEQRLRRMQRETGCDPTREDTYRLTGVQLIENVREALQLPVRTFDTAAIYYHKFRLSFRDAEYNFQDAALASLFVACKVEDTIKKSREILCAAYNLKTPDHPTTPDDKMFDQTSKIINGLERLILETIGFDFRVRYPQKHLAKAIRMMIGPHVDKVYLTVAYEMCLDMYKTFTPIKQTTYGIVLPILELSALVTGKHIDQVQRGNLPPWQVTRQGVIETMLDLLDLYTQFHKSTKVGQRYDLAIFIDIKIKINGNVDQAPELERFEQECHKCEVEREANPTTPGSATSPISLPSAGSVRRSTKSQDGTMRFVFDNERARREAEMVDEYFREEYEEYEVEVEEAIPEAQRPHGHHPRERGRGRGHGYGANHGHGPRDPGWHPYPRHRGHDRGGRGRKHF